MKKQESGFNPVLYTENYTGENRTKDLWGHISGALLIQSAERKRPYLLRVLDARAGNLDRI
jgi:hypothetical protein